MLNENEETSNMRLRRTSPPSSSSRLLTTPPAHSKVRLASSDFLSCVDHAHKQISYLRDCHNTTSTAWKDPRSGSGSRRRRRRAATPRRVSVCVRARAWARCNRRRRIGRISHRCSKQRSSQVAPHQTPPPPRPPPHRRC
eukprot:324542-Hanusia_phi.AAC.1